MLAKGQVTGFPEADLVLVYSLVLLKFVSTAIKQTSKPNYIGKKYFILCIALIPIQELFWGRETVIT